MSHFAHYLGQLAPGYLDSPAWWLGAALPASWFALAIVWLTLAVTRERMAERREAGVAEAKRRHPAKGKRSLADELEWLLILEATGLDEMAEGNR